MKKKLQPQNFLYRQGDVALFEITREEFEQIKLSTKLTKTSRIVARGEHSDHSHIITGQAEVLTDSSKNLYVDATNASIEHLIESIFKKTNKAVWTKEHLPIKLEKGRCYKVVQQKELNPFTQKAVKVWD